jgi:hypothetical protein
MTKRPPLDDCIQPDGSIDTHVMAKAIGIRPEHLAHLSWDQRRMKYLYELICTVRPWVTSNTEAWSWVRCHRIDAMEGLTADAALREGRGEELFALIRKGAPELGSFAHRIPVLADTKDGSLFQRFG